MICDDDDAKDVDVDVDDLDGDFDDRHENNVVASDVAVA